MLLKNTQHLDITLGAQMVLIPENQQDYVKLALLFKDIGLNYFVIKPYSQHLYSEVQKEVSYDSNLIIDIEKFAEEKNLIPNDITDKLYKVATDESLNKETKIVYVVNTELMEAILNELITTYDAESIPIKAKDLSKFAAQIYADIVENEDDRILQLKMVKIATSAYKRAIKK